MVRWRGVCTETETTRAPDTPARPNDRSSQQAQQAAEAAQQEGKAGQLEEDLAKKGKDKQVGERPRGWGWWMCMGDGRRHACVHACCGCPDTHPITTNSRNQINESGAGGGGGEAGGGDAGGRGPPQQGASARVFGRFLVGGMVRMWMWVSLVLGRTKMTDSLIFSSCTGAGGDEGAGGEAARLQAGAQAVTGTHHSA